MSQTDEDQINDTLTFNFKAVAGPGLTLSAFVADEQGNRYNELSTRDYDPSKVKLPDGYYVDAAQGWREKERTCSLRGLPDGRYTVMLVLTRGGEEVDTLSGAYFGHGASVSTGTPVSMDDMGNYVAGIDSLSTQTFDPASGIPITGFVYTEEHWKLSHITVEVDGATPRTFKLNQLNMRSTERANAQKARDSMRGVTLGSQGQGAFGVLYKDRSLRNLDEGVHLVRVQIAIAGEQTLVVSLETKVNISKEGEDVRDIKAWTNSLGY